MTLVALLVALLVGGTALASYLFYFRPVAEAITSSTGQTVPRLVTSGTSAPASGAAAASAAPAPTPPSLTGTSRINVLLLGSDTDAKFQGDYNTQIMMVVSIDPATKSVSMFSIPRDLWVPIPGEGMGKIGVAYGAGGLALARQTIENNFGIPIHYYAWVGLDGFIKVIDTFGGVDVDVSHPIVDDSYPDDVNSPDPYAYRRLYIPAGWQHLDGTRALEYVRSRHGDLVGDFGRSARQQEVLDALRSKVNAKDVVGRLPELANDLNGDLKTDMSLTDLAKFAYFADQIRGQPVHQYTLNTPYSDTGTATDGESIQIPNWPAIRPLVDQVFGLHTTGVLPMAIPYIAPPPRPTVAASASASSSAKASASASGTPAARETVTVRETATALAERSRASSSPAPLVREPVVAGARTPATVQTEPVPTPRRAA